MCGVTKWHQEWREPAYQVCSGLLFGLLLAVRSFNTVARFTEAVGRRLLYVLTSLYFDDAHITHWASSKGSDLLGTHLPRRSCNPCILGGDKPRLGL